MIINLACEILKTHIPLEEQNCPPNKKYTVFGTFLGSYKQCILKQIEYFGIIFELSLLTNI